MDSKKAMLILGLLAMVLVISSEVSARELAETSTNAKEGELVTKEYICYFYSNLLKSKGHFFMKAS